MRTCKICGCTLTGSYKKAYCSIKCKQKAQWQKNKNDPKYLAYTKEYQKKKREEANDNQNTQRNLQSSIS